MKYGVTYKERVLCLLTKKLKFNALLNCPSGGVDLDSELEIFASFSNLT